VATTAAAAAEGGQTATQKPVEAGLFPASFQIPGTGLSLANGGYVKVDFIQDFKAIGNVDDSRPTRFRRKGPLRPRRAGTRTSMLARHG